MRSAFTQASRSRSNPARDGELLIRRATGTFEEAFRTLTGTYPPDYLARLDAQDEQR
jgi:hypothetical protein